MQRLRRSDCAKPGIARRRRGRGFEYRHQTTGERIEDPGTLARIAALAIPPAWRDVWICEDPGGHLQATGHDAAGRKQYLYHPRWRAHRDRRKFADMLDFAHALPRLRRRVARDLKSTDDLTQARVTACAVRLLDLGFFRIGSDDYAQRNESYGLTTLLREHVTIDGDELVFDFPAKSGQRRVQAIVDRQALAVVTVLKRRRARSRQLLAHHEGHRWTDLSADAVNDYLKRHTGGPHTAKDFRTWNATVLAAVALAHGDADERDAVRTVAAYLGNTPQVCRSAYIDPRVLDRARAGQRLALDGGADLARPRVRARVERAVLELLD